jgi:ferredoxin
MMRQLYPVDHQDPLETTRAILEKLWHVAEFEAGYLPYWDGNGAFPQGGLLQQASQLGDVDPFAPVMPFNHAPAALQALRDNPQRRVAVFLRPCEWRSFNTLARRSGEQFGNLFAISADCTGVIPLQDYEALSVGDPQRMTLKVLHFAALGGILPSRYQNSCQLCEDPFPAEVDLHIELFGIPTEEQLVLIFRDPEPALALSEQTQTSEVPAAISARRQQVLHDLSRWRASSFEKQRAKLGSELLSIQGLASHLKSCESCLAALKAQCPLIELEMLMDPLDPDLEQFQDWLHSCSGCGVCDQSCPQDYPLFGVIFSLRGIQ